MAKRRSSTALRIVQAPAARPIVIAAPRRSGGRRRSYAIRRRSRGRRRSHGGSFGLGASPLMSHAIGGALFGFAVKSGWVDKLPSVPLIGRTGLAAIGLNYFASHGGGDLARKAAYAAAVLAGYQLGDTGSIHGDASPDDDNGY